MLELNKWEKLKGLGIPSNKRPRKLKQQQALFEVYLKDLEARRKNDALALKFIKDCVDDSIFPLIADAKRAKEAWGILEETFGARGVIKLKIVWLYTVL